MWDGQLRWWVTEAGAPVLEFSGLVAGEEVLCETFSPMVLEGTDGRVCLVTAVLQAPIRDPRIGEHLHRGVTKHLNAHPVDPLTGDEARAVLEKRWSELIVFSPPDDTGPVPQS